MSENESAPVGQSGSVEMSAVKRKRIQQIFDHAAIQFNQKNYDYASDLYIQCVAADPGNMVYVQAFLENLKKKYSNNKKGDGMAFFKIGGPRKAAKKALGNKDYVVSIENGLQALRFNPWDVTTLTILWEASLGLGFTEVPLAYMKIALEGNPKDITVNKSLAEALKNLHRYNEAISCWRRIEQVRGNADDETQRSITELIVAKNVYESGGKMKEDQRAKAVITTDASGGRVEMTQEEYLKKQIRERPKDSKRYIALADLYIANEDFKTAAAVLEDAVKQTGETDNREILDKMEDSTVRYMRQNLIELERKEGKATEKWKKFRYELNLKELEIWQGRCERYPNNLSFKYELGMRYKLNRQYKEAIMQFQIAQNEPRRKGLCCLELGLCFGKIGQYVMAITAFDEAIANIPDRDAENKKRCYYEAGDMAYKANNVDEAEKYLKSLAAMDFNYKNVAELLDKIEKMRNNIES